MPLSIRAISINKNPKEYGRSSKWPALMHSHLKTHPTCEVCGTKSSLNVHHIRPYHLFPSQELDPTNLLTLCETPGQNHHFLFGHLLNWKAWNPAAVADAAEWLHKIQNKIFTADDAAIKEVIHRMEIGY